MPAARVKLSDISFHDPDTATAPAVRLAEYVVSKSCLFVKDALYEMKYYFNNTVIRGFTVIAALVVFCKYILATTFPYGSCPTNVAYIRASVVLNPVIPIKVLPSGIVKSS